MGNLSRKQIEYILANGMAKSARQIARELGVGRPEVEKILAHPESFADFIPKNDNLSKGLPILRKRSTFLIILALICFSLSIRTETYLMPHIRGDQSQYISTAMKLEQEGIKGYSMRGIDMVEIDKFYSYFKYDPKKVRGTLIKSFEIDGAHFYDMPLLTTPPALSYALMISHKIFDSEKKYMTPKKYWEPDNGIYEASQYIRNQLYAILVPLCFSCLLVVCVYFLGRSMFGEEAGIWASFLMVICPLDILTSQKVWADDMVSFFVVLSVLLFTQAWKRNSAMLSIAAGVAAGLGAITKGTGGFIIFPVFIYYIYASKDAILKKEWKKVIFNKTIILFYVAAFITILPWYGLIAKTYGTPFHLREKGLVDEDAMWWNLIYSRPWYMYLVNIPAQTPILILGYFVIFDLIKTRSKNNSKALLFLWYISYLYLLRNNREGRYMLPAIPALAVLSGFYLFRIRIWLDFQFKGHIGRALIAIVAVLCAFWSISVGSEAVSRDHTIIVFPF